MDEPELLDIRCSNATWRHLLALRCFKQGYTAATEQVARKLNNLKGGALRYARRIRIYIGI